MKRTFVIIIILISIISCKSEIDCQVDSSVIKSNDSIISKIKSDTLGQKWWNDYLAKLEEPNLRTESNESYRLIIYNSMWESAKTYRIRKDLFSYNLVYKEYGGEQIESQNSTLTTNNVSPLSKQEWDEIKSSFESTKFWSLPVLIDRNGLDGTTWILEGFDPKGNNCTDRNYHIVARWQPLDTMKVMQINRKLIELNER